MKRADSPNFFLEKSGVCTQYRLADPTLLVFFLGGHNELLDRFHKIIQFNEQKRLERTEIAVHEPPC
jgi:hypothetical protein